MLKSNWGSTYEDRPTPQGDRIDESVSIPFDEATDMAHRPIGFGWLVGVFDWGITAGRVRARIEELRQIEELQAQPSLEDAVVIVSFDSPPFDEWRATFGSPPEPDPGPLDWDWEYQAPRESRTDDACYTEYDREVAEQEDNDES